RPALYELDAVAELGFDAGRKGDGQPGLARAAGSGQRQQPGAAEEAASRAEFMLPADKTCPRPWYAAGCLAGVRGSQMHHLSSPGAVTHGHRRSAAAPADSMVSPIPARAPSESNGGALDLRKHSGYVALGLGMADCAGSHFWTLTCSTACSAA